MKNFSVLMLDGEGDISLFVARCLGRIQGLKLHVLSQNNRVPLRYSRHRSTFQLLPKEDNSEKWLASITQVIRQTQPDIIFPVSEAIRLASSQKEHLLKLTNITAIPSVDMFDIAVDKWLLAKFLVKNNIPCPTTILYTNDENFRESLNHISFPVLIKPIQGSDGRGIEFFNNSDTLLQALEKNERFINKYIVQNFIDGYDLGCSVLCRDGKILAYTIQKGLIFRNRRFAPSAGVEFVQDNQAFDVVNQWASATKWDGVAHLDLRYDKQNDQVKIIEVNPRYWGSLLGSLVAGVNFPYLACLETLEIPFTRPDYDLKKFVSGNAAIKGGIRQLVGKDKTKFSFKETSWRFAVTDPLAEISKLGRQFLRS